jgi:hypothetical protein
MSIQRRRFSVRDDDLRADALNEATRVVRLADLRPSCEEAFISHYDEIRRRCAPLAGQDGLAIVAIDEAGVAASAFLPRRREALEVAVVGRHRMADVWLRSPSVALRHLLILTRAGHGSAPTRYRVLDLRTETGLMDERGQALRSFEADGPVFFQIESTSFLALPTATPFAWPDDPLAAWNAFPSRMYDGEPFHHRRRNGLRERKVWDDDDDAKTSVGIGPGVVDASRALAKGTTVGTIELQTERGRLSLSVDDAALRAGILFGRYERCDVGGVEVLEVRGISRVHVMLLQVDGELHVIDTASTMGVTVGKMAVRSHPVTSGTEIILSQGLASIRWNPVH